MLKFRITKPALVAATRACASIVSKAGVNAIYESLLVRGTPGEPLAFSATDLETGIVLRADATVEEAGSAVLPAGALAALAAKLPDGEVRVEVDAETYRGTVRAAKGKFTLAGYPPGDFPELPAPEKETPLVLPAARVATAFGRVAHAMSKERMRYGLTGVLVASKGGRVEFVATDGKRLALDAIDAPGAPEFSAIVGAAGVGQIVRVAEAAGEGTIALSVARNHFFAATEREAVVTRVVEGSFPDYRKGALPTREQEKSRATFVRADLIAALDRANLVDVAVGAPIALETLDGELLVLAVSPERETRETVAADLGGEAVRIGFTTDFLIDALRAVEGETATMVFHGPTWPAVVREAEMIQVVMPCSLDAPAKKIPSPGSVVVS